MPRPSRAAGLPSSSRSSKDLKKYTVAIDFGTTTASCAYRPPSSQYPLQSTGQVKQILFDDRLFYTEVQATWLRGGRGRFCWGLDLRNKINSGEVSTEDVVKLPKLQLYDGLENEIIVKQERAKLERLGKTLDQLIVDLLFHLYECCRNSIKAQEGLTKLPVDPKCFEVLLCVPQDFSNLQTERISKLAIEAQIPQPRIVSEAECAASFHFQGVVDRCSQKMPISCGVGDVVLVGDAGGGTLDGGAFKFETNAQGGASTHLRPLRGRLFGHLCGSEFINQHFLDWLKDEWRGRISDTSTGEISASGDLVSLLPVLEIGLDHALGQASTDFESCKESWDPDNVRWSKTVTILGQDETRKIAVFLDANLMRRFFKPIVNKVLTVLLDHCKSDVKYVILTGGLSKSKYLKERAERMFGARMQNELFLAPDNRIHPVACGAILRFQNIAFELPSESQVSFGIVNDQEAFDPGDHPDACDAEGCPNSTLVADDYWNRFEQGVVHDRISRWFTLSETSRAAEEIYWQVYEPETHNLKMTARVCWTARRNLKDHEPLYGKDKKIRAGIHELTERFEIDVDPEAYGYKPKWAENGDCYFSVQAAIVLSSTDGVLTFKWYIAQAGKGPYNDQEEEVKNPEKAFRNAVLLYEKEHAIHDLRWILRDRLKA